MTAEGRTWTTIIIILVIVVVAWIWYANSAARYTAAPSAPNTGAPTNNYIYVSPTSTNQTPTQQMPY